MSQNRTAAKLTEKAIKLLEGRNYGYIATLMKDGSPQVSPVWVDRDGDYILVNTAIGRLKQVNSKRNPRVAIAIADASNQQDMVTIRGVVAEQTTKGADAHIDKLAKKYLGKDKYPWRGPDETRVILRIKPEHVTS
jgi:PPOX class probable F420-dependent enzyme